MPQSLRVLLVEDSEDDAELVRLELGRGGYDLHWERVDTEREYRAALDQAWQLIICDFAMRGFDGLTAFAIYRERGLDVPFIFVSGALGEERAVQAMQLGARDYILKGNLARLNAAVQRELAEADNRRRQREAEELAANKQELLALAIEASGAAVFDYAVGTSPGDPTCTAPRTRYDSARWAEILGRASDEPPGSAQFPPWLERRADPADMPSMRAAYAAMLEGETDRFRFAGRLKHDAGHWITAEVIARAMARDPGGHALRVVGVLMDRSEQTRLEEQLWQAQKMEAVGRLAGGVAHDFNNLLTAIFSFGGFVLEELGESTQAREDMKEVLQAAKRAESLTAQLLAFSRRRLVAPRTISPALVIASLERMLGRLLGEDVSLVCEVSPALSDVRIDPGALEQVLVNLAVNARDALPRGGELTLHAVDVTVDDAFLVQRGGREPVAPGPYVLISVTDDGTGMTEETLARLFEPFYTTKEAGKGTGLGLATCWGIVKQAGGFILVESTLGRGSRFEVYLPRAAEKRRERRVTPPPTSQGGNETILVVEDDEQVRKLSVRTLTRAGYTVVEAASGLAALTDARRFDLLFSDVVMPGMSGIELAAKLRERHGGELKVLFASGYTANAVSAQAAFDDTVELLEKPFTPQALLHKIREILDGG